jgi:threonine dehydrogenase-like Zn-dependent dehydrogenase
MRQTIPGRECTAVVSEIGFENSANVELANRYIPTRHAHPPITPMCFGNARRRAQRVLGPVLKDRTVSVPVLLDVFAGQVCVCKELTLKMGQTYMQRCMRPLIERMERGEIDPCFEKTHWFKIDEAPHAYDIFRNKEDECMKCVLEPQ